MKRTLTILLALTMLFALTACGEDDTAETATPTEEALPILVSPRKKRLIVRERWRMLRKGNGPIVVFHLIRALDTE